MRRHLSVFPAVALVLVAASVEAQTRPLYTTDGYVSRYTIQGGTVINSFGSIGGCDYAIAVNTNVRTAGCASGFSGGEYTLGGTYIGPTATNTFACCSADGTTDGTYNYSTDYLGSVVRAGLDWSGLTPLFSPQIGRMAGITYDSGNNSLWLGQFSGVSSGIFQYAMNGTLLSYFYPNLGGDGITALAYDATDQTLWFSNSDPNATLFQYSRSGVYLNQMNVSGTDGYLRGAEFQFQLAAVPEPATFVLLGTGLIGVAGIARRRRRA